MNNNQIRLEKTQLEAFKAITAPTSDPIMTYVDQRSLLPVDIDEMAAGQVLTAYAVHESGEIEPILVTCRGVDADKPGEYWWKLMLSDLLDLLEDMSGKQTQALRGVLDMFDPDTGIIVATQRELAENCGVSLKTMNQVLGLMIRHNLIAMKSPGVYVINPTFMSQGKSGRRYRKSLIMYKEIAAKRNGQKQQFAK